MQMSVQLNHHWLADSCDACVIAVACERKEKEVAISCKSPLSPAHIQIDLPISGLRNSCSFWHSSSFFCSLKNSILITSRLLLSKVSSWFTMRVMLWIWDNSKCKNSKVTFNLQRSWPFWDGCYLGVQAVKQR